MVKKYLLLMAIEAKKSTCISLLEMSLDAAIFKSPVAMFIKCNNAHSL